MLERLGEARQRDGEQGGAEAAYSAAIRVLRRGNLPGMRARAAQVVFRAMLVLCLWSLREEDVRKLDLAIDLLETVKEANGADEMLHAHFSELQRKAASLLAACEVRHLHQHRARRPAPLAPIGKNWC